MSYWETTEVIHGNERIFTPTTLVASLISMCVLYRTTIYSTTHKLTILRLPYPHKLAISWLHHTIHKLSIPLLITQSCSTITDFPQTDLSVLGVAGFLDLVVALLGEADNKHSQQVAIGGLHVNTGLNQGLQHTKYKPVSKHYHTQTQQP